LVKIIYEVVKRSQLFKDYSLRDQIQKSAISIPSNVAEGYERESNREFVRFLYIAKGSCGELRTQAFIAMEIGCITKNDYTRIDSKSRKISGMIMNLIKKLRTAKTIKP